MTTQKLFKRRVRERMTKTRERYAAARSHVAAKRDETEAADAANAGNEPAQIDLGPALELASDDKIVAATGRGWTTWFALLDRWGGRERQRTDIVAYLKNDLGSPPWWTQAIATGYQRTRGTRAKHQQADGFTIYASKTIRVPVDTLFEAFVDDESRRRWLTDGAMSNRSSQRGKVARFDWAGDGSRVMVTFDAKGADRSTAYVAHERLPDAAAGEAAKVAWKARLGVLATHLAPGVTGG